MMDSQTKRHTHTHTRTCTHLHKRATVTVTNALWKMEFSKLFVFESFGIVQLPKFGIFLEIFGVFKLAKISQK